MSSVVALEPDSPSDDHAIRAGERHARGTRQYRSRRLREVRARSISKRQITKVRLQIVNAELGDMTDLPQRPRMRGECKDGPRPCPFVSCQHHLYLDVLPKSGSIKLNFPDLEPDQLEETCALDVAARGGAKLEQVGQLMNITRERVRQIEERALRILAAKKHGLRDYQGHAHDFDFSEPIAPELPIVRREPRDGATDYPSAPSAEPSTAGRVSAAPSCDSPVEPVDSPEEVPMPVCIEDGCNTIVRPGKFKEPPAPGTEGMCRQCAKKHIGGAEPIRRKPTKPASVDTASTTMDVSGLSVADLLESHNLVQAIGIELARAIAARIQNGGSGS